MKYDLSKSFDQERYKVRTNQLYKNKAKVEVKQFFENRSVNQNSMYWAWCKCMGEHAGYSKDEIHKYIAKLILGTKEVVINGVIDLQIKSTADLDTKQFSDYCEKVRHWASEELGCYLPTPEEKVFADFYFQYKD